MEAGKVYHVYNRGNNRQNIFFDEENYLFFLNKLAQYLITKIEVLAYCLMPNHFHLLIRVRPIEGQPDNETSRLAAKAFKNFLISYSKAINKRYNRTGALFQTKFKRKEVDNDFYYSWLVQYIHLNPVKAGLCKDPADWKFSSYTAITSERPTKVSVKEIINWFGSIVEFIRIYKERLIDENQIKQYLFYDDD